MEKHPARTIKDDLKVVEDLGVEIVDSGSFLKDSKYSNYYKISLIDVNIEQITSTISEYDINFKFDKIAVAAQDHGFSEKMGDRDFRFEKKLGKS